MYYDICSSKKRKRGLKNVAQLFSRKIEISSSREKYAPTRSCGAFEGVKIHGFGLGSRQKSTQLRHSYRIEHFLRRFRRLPHRKTQLLKLNAILRGGVLAFLFSSVIFPYLFLKQLRFWRFVPASRTPDFVYFQYPLKSRAFFAFDLHHFNSSANRRARF